MRYAIFLILLSAVLHVALWALSGFASDSRFLLVGAVIHCLLALALITQIWGSRWIAFMIMLATSAVALGSFVAPPLEPYWIFGLIFIVHMIAAVLLFGAIWAGRPKTNAA
ncbi:MAG: hypothetical protein AAFR71_05915 [Pseudomonadota bacterium]